MPGYESSAKSVPEPVPNPEAIADTLESLGQSAASGGKITIEPNLLIEASKAMKRLIRDNALMKTRLGG